MATIHRRKDSQFWYCSFRVPILDRESGQQGWKQVQRNTRQIDEKKARRAADEIERATLAEFGSGDEKGQKMLALLREATEEAVKGRLSEPLARKCLIDLFKIANGVELSIFSVRTWFGEWKERKKRIVKPATFSLYRGALDSFLVWLGERADHRVEAISTQDVRRWRDELRDEGRTGKTVGQYQKAVSSAFRAAVAEGVLLRNPADGLEYLPKEDSTKREPFTVEELTALIEHADTEWRLAIRVGYYTGLRLRDVANLKWADVDLTGDQVIRIEPMKQARKKETKKRLEIPLHPALISSFTEYPSSDDSTAPVFPNLAGRETGGTRGLSWQFTQLMEKARVDPGVKRTRKEGEAGRKVSAKGFHSLRHTFVSALANTGVSQELRQELSGHDDADSHRIYTHHDRERLKGALGQIPEV